MTVKIYTKEILEEAVKNSLFFTEVCKKLGMRTIGGNSYQNLKRKIRDYKIDTSHFHDARKAGYLASGLIEKKKHFSEHLVNGKTKRMGSSTIRRVLKESGRQYVCSECGLGPIWNKKELILHVDHINGNWSDCREENLRFLCPNCHTQTPTYCNRKGYRCKNCNKKIKRKSTYCRRCMGLFAKRKRKVNDRPSLTVLLKEVEELGYRGTGKKYGVSDNAVRKWIKTERKRFSGDISDGSL